MEPWLAPMLATAVDTVPTGPDWSLEPKFDGWRLVVHRGHGPDIRVFAGRNGSEYTGRMPWLEDQIREMCPPDTALDGEIVGTEWGDVQGHMTRTSGGTVPEGALQYVVFDILRANGQDVRSMPLSDRYQLLNALGWDRAKHVIPTPRAEATQDAYERIVAAGGEGVVVKRLSARYANSRSTSWVKIKAKATDEARITGFKPGEPGSRWQGGVGAFEVEMLDTGAKSRVKCGTDERHISAANEPEKWLGVVIEIEHNGLSAKGVPRHPRFIRRRDDRLPDRPVRTAQTNPQPRRARMDWIRNYNAMGEAKLRRCIAELQAGRGDAVDRVKQNGGDVDANLRAAETALHNKMGLPAR